MPKMSMTASLLHKFPDSSIKRVVTSDTLISFIKAHRASIQASQTTQKV
jgi:hypothetical protein